PRDLPSSPTLRSSDLAAAMKAVSAPASSLPRAICRAAAKRRSTAKARPATRTAIVAVSESRRKEDWVMGHASTDRGVPMMIGLLVRTQQLPEGQRVDVAEHRRA